MSSLPAIQQKKMSYYRIGMSKVNDKDAKWISATKQTDKLLREQQMKLIEDGDFYGTRLRLNIQADEKKLESFKSNEDY